MHKAESFGLGFRSFLSGQRRLPAAENSGLFPAGADPEVLGASKK